MLRNQMVSFGFKVAKNYGEFGIIITLKNAFVVTSDGILKSDLLIKDKNISCINADVFGGDLRL